MNSSSSFEIDFSNAKYIHQLSFRINTKPGSASKLNNFVGFTPPAGVENACGVCALASMLHFHKIGWSHLPKDRQQNPVNDPFVLETLRWSGLPDLRHPLLNSSPEAIVEACEKAGLITNWYAGNPENTSFEFLCSELTHHWPVMVLMNQGEASQPGPMGWEVVYRVDKETVYSTHAQGNSYRRERKGAEFREQWRMEPLALGYNLITVSKD